MSTHPAHLASFVFDSALPLPQYSKLIQPQGPIHKLIQRLIEKHGGEEHLSVSMLVTPGDQVKTGSKRPGKVYREEFRSPSAFLTSLPKLGALFATKASRSLQWPSFGQKPKADSLREKKRKRLEESALLNAVVGGLELLQRPQSDRRHLPSKTFISLTPSSATPFLDSACTPSSSQTKPLPPSQRYMVVITSGTPSREDHKPVEEDTEAVLVDANWDPIWDGQGWNDVAEAVKVGDTSSDPEKVWFSIPVGMDIHLSGFAIESHEPTIPPPQPTVQEPQPQPPTVPQQPPATNSPATNPPASAPSSIFNPANLAKMDPQMINSMLTTIRAQSQQPNARQDPRVHQIIAMLEYQLRTFAAKAVQGQGNAAGPSQGQGDDKVAGPGESVMLAIQQQREKQAQLQQAMQSMAPAATTAAPPAPGPPRGQLVWSGAITWGNPTSGGSIPVDVMIVGSGNTDSIYVNKWPKELLIRTLAPIDLQVISSYARANSTPIVNIAPSDKGGLVNDPSYRQKYTQLGINLGTNKRVALVEFPGMQDRGIVIFPAPLNSGEKAFRLMGLICMATPFPQLPRAVPATVPPQRAPSGPTNIPNQPLPQTAFRPSTVQPSASMLNKISGGTANSGVGGHQAQQSQQFNLLMQQAQARQSQAAATLAQTQSQNNPANAPVQNRNLSGSAQPQSREFIQAQYQQLVGFAQKIGLTIQPQDPATVTPQKLQELMAGLRQADAKIKQNKLLQQQQQMGGGGQQGQGQGSSQMSQAQVAAQMARMQQMMQQQQQQGGSGMGMRGFGQ
ncbi:hypothetical protein B9479_000769 [Cryptococcus floricola]|uniref:Uncharacterized protein n=1 Tax=Cryptococcus floricola TaxID=2591691 RepID=A0A5D3B7B0_9TREE|nr:hypothetical protein B9479_000769 [Cryptococcus floricola]